MFLRKLLVIVVPLVLCGLCVFFLPLLGGFGLWSDLLQGLILGALLALLLLNLAADFRHRVALLFAYRAWSSAVII